MSEKKITTVGELITSLSGYNKDLEVGYELGKSSIELLIGEDPDDKGSGAVTIEKPEWC